MSDLFKRYNGLFILAAVIVVMAYLVAHPHVQTYYIDTYSYKSIDSKDAFDVLMASPGYQRQMIFTSLEACERQATADNEFTRAAAFSCKIHNVFAWGWDA